MANTNAPFGFRPISRVGGYPFSLSEYAKPASDAQAIFQYDLVYKVTGGSLVPIPESPFGYNAPSVQSTYAAGFTPGTTALIVGSVANFGAASTATVHQVADEYDLLMIGQAKTGTAIATQTHIGKNANISKTTAGSTLTKQSGLAVDGATIATTATLDLKLFRVYMVTPNAEGDSAILEVIINTHFYNPRVAGV
jgi:hypothetical protein